MHADEMVKSIDALSRSQARQLLFALGLGTSRVPLLLPGATRSSVPLAPEETPEDVRCTCCYTVLYTIQPQLAWLHADENVATWHSRP